MRSLVLFMLASLFGLALNTGLYARDTRPNILWITIEDWGPELSCYGTKGIHTPHVDKLASEGMRFQWAFTTSPVCSTSRSAMMTGFHQNYIGANQHREHNKQPLPHGIKPIPHLFQEAGYFTALMSWKTDCNFTPNTKGELFMGEDWSERKSGQPFFARITFGGTHRTWNRDPQRPIGTEDIELPPYYPDTSFCRRDWANGLEQMQLVDREVGELLKRLDDEGLSDNTIVFFIADHGRCHIRGKQFLYDGGVRVPTILWGPGRVPANTTCDCIATTMDVMPTFAALAGAEAPSDRVIDGEDIRHLFHGKFDKADPDKAYFYYLRIHLQAVRQGRWKLHLPRKKEPVGAAPFSRNVHIAPADRIGFETPFLVDLESDIGETTNLSAQNPQVVERLLTLAEAMREDLGDHDRVGKNMRFFDPLERRPTQPPVPAPRKPPRKDPSNKSRNQAKP